MRKIKISELPLYSSLKGLFTIGTDNQNRSVKVSLEFIEDETNEAINNANTQTAAAVKYAKDSTDAAVKKVQQDTAAAIKSVESATAAAIKSTQDATNTAVSNANRATTYANNAAATAQEKASAAEKATIAANTATDNAKAATAAANKAKTDAETATGNAVEATNKTIKAKDEAITATNNAKVATDAAITAKENADNATAGANVATAQVLASLARLIPSSLTVSCLKRITLGNKSELFIKAILTPENVMQNVAFIGDNKAVSVAPDGRISVIDIGQSVVHVIPTCNTALAKSVVIEVGQPTIRLVNTRKKMRFTSTGALRLN